MTNIDRVIMIVLDSVGIGELPDAAEYGDKGSNTLGNIVKNCKGINLPNLCRLGMGKIDGVDYLSVPEHIVGSYGRMDEVSKGKDTITGHWEIAGLQLAHPFPTYPDGFPKEVLDEFEKLTGRGVLANCAASGTEIIKEYGEEHMKTGKLIVYTSADSVFQIAAHEELVPLEELYRICSIAREMLQGDHMVGRVIARPFIGEPGNFTRTPNRRDFSAEPTSDTILDIMSKKGLDVIAVGKIEDIFSKKGVTLAEHTKNNMDGVDVTLKFMAQKNTGMIFTNLVDFDMVFGHRNNPEGYKQALEEFDNRLPEILSAMGDNDMLIITADHGCDPTTPSTDHSREYVPVVIYGKGIKEDVNLGTRKTFADIACTVAEVFNAGNIFPGRSFLREIIK
ncbi:phosphopentomutase [Ruminiclostridium cellulolyticum]|uniref:Phosphopentomutase n=1 Tax=Ruminiclostridium cellulolyticum (strain ATCC 35319 / DSM 5812 / JCM 6584 / H10) TaxID=394503 RepID=B8I0G9_RUMCH|nr:phosphopentomutase [Ruminiclostridium cellulolyticum]ACL77495.1 phosphopentomutase [Ruminiclostridium cellulolyticum H10]